MTQTPQGETCEARVAYLCLQKTTEGQASHAHVNEIANGLRRRGMRVDIFEPRRRSPSVGAIGRVFSSLETQVRLLRRLRHGEYDVVYVRAHPLAWPTARVAGQRGIPVVQECNGPYTDFYRAWPQAKYVAGILEWLAHNQYEQATELIAVSEALASWLEGVANRRSEVIGNGANEQLFSPGVAPLDELTQFEPYAIFFGSLAPWQGIEAVLEATRCPDWPHGLRLVVIGDGALRCSVDEAVRRGDVVGLGNMPYTQLGGAVARAVCSMVLKSEDYDTGPSPLKLFESMACGVPVIATDIPGLREIVSRHDCGILIPRNTSTAVATAVRLLYEDPSRAAAMGGRGRRAVESEYSWDARADSTYHVICRALRRAARGRPNGE